MANRPSSSGQRERLYREYVVVQAAGYPDPFKPHPMTRENAQRFAEEHRKLPTFPAIVRTRLVSEWQDACDDPKCAGCSNPGCVGRALDHTDAGNAS